ncbi:MAG: NAD-dependent epimerase/dehydratase family protein [Hyphomicrobiaceae bacterium]
MQRVLVTGAAGGVSQQIRQHLRSRYPEIVLSDIVKPQNIERGEVFISADLADSAACEEICEGIDGIVHLGGMSVEQPWEDILRCNIAGCYNIFEAARKKKVKRIIFASSNHAVGFYPRSQTIADDVTLRPDSRYGVSKAFGEALGAMYAYKHGLSVTCLRIGNVGPVPLDERRLSIWISASDLFQLIKIGLERPDIVFEIMYGISDNRRAWFDNKRAFDLGYAPEGQSEPFAADILTASQGEPKNEVSEYYQGGTYCADEYTADFNVIMAHDK